jgi:hypothetical protein
MTVVDPEGVAQTESNRGLIRFLSVMCDAFGIGGDCSLFNNCRTPSGSCSGLLYVTSGPQTRRW